MAASENVKAKSLDSADETRTFEHGKLELATIDEFSASRVTLEPGWKWSEDIKPLAQTPSCQVQHTGYVISGQMHVVHDDGTEQDISAGDMYVLRPGHDAWITGDETFIGVDFSNDMARFAREH
jgi:quercetin dioxygenase-like cupin family protein